MKKLIALALMILAGAASAADTGRYVASTDDKTVAGMVQRWGSQDGRTIKWEADDVEIRDAASINQLAHLQSAATLDEAVRRTVKLLEEIAQNRNDLMPLTVCVYAQGKVYMAIRELRESCSKSIR